MAAFLLDSALEGRVGNRMAIGKREIVLLIIVGLILYVLGVYKLVYEPTSSDADTKNAEIAVVEDQKAKLDADITNKQIKLSEIKTKTSNNEKLDNYLLNNANVLDGYNLIGRISKLLGHEVDMKIEAPVTKNSVGGKPYFEMKLSFAEVMTYQQLVELVNYLEGGSQKIKVTELNIETPKAIPTNISPVLSTQLTGSADAKTIQPGNLNYFLVSMKISVFSLNQGVSNKLFEYGRHTFNRYTEKDGQFLVPSSSTAVTSSVVNSDAAAAALNADLPSINIEEGTSLTSADNLQIYGSDMANGVIRVIANKLHDVTITINDNGYTVESPGSVGEYKSLSEALPTGIFKVNIKMNVPDIADNKNIRLNVKIINKSSKQVVFVKDDLRKICKITDRSGKEIVLQSASEKVLIQ